MGRVAAMVDPLFRRWIPGSGFFGFFECMDNAEVSDALLGAAEDLLRGRGCSFILGPVNQTTHEEVGFLLEGSGEPPTFLTPYNPPFYPTLVQAAGYEPVRDYLAFDWTPSSATQPSVRRLARSMDSSRSLYRGISIRPVDPLRWEQDMRSIHRLFNRCFANLWGFVEISWPEFKERSDGFRAFYRPDLAILAEREDTPVGFGLILPDVNTVLAHLGGRLLPLGWLRARRKIPAIRTGRFILVGVHPDSTGRGIAPAMVLHLRDAVVRAGYEKVEVSLVQATNEKMLRVVEGFGCRRSKLFRVFGKRLRG